MSDWREWMSTVAVIRLEIWIKMMMNLMFIVPIKDKFSSPTFYSDTKSWLECPSVPSFELTPFDLGRSGTCAFRTSTQAPEIHMVFIDSQKNLRNGVYLYFKPTSFELDKEIKSENWNAAWGSNSGRVGRRQASSRPRQITADFATRKTILEPNDEFFRVKCSDAVALLGP